MSKIGIPTSLTVTCPGCGRHHQDFMATDGSKDGLYAEYTCQNCDHTALLELDPDERA